MDKITLDNAIAYFSNDLKLQPWILKYSRPGFAVYAAPFKSLIKYIIYQQLSMQSAKAIYTRFLDLFNNKPTPTTLNVINDVILKDIGISKQKINYIKEITKYFLNHNIDFNSLTNKEVYDELIQIKGIGPWTIDIFLMFTLYRTDILPIGDLGIKKGFKILYNLDELPTDKFMIEKSKKWNPYESIASMYLWKIVDGDIVF